MYDGRTLTERLDIGLALAAKLSIEGNHGEGRHVFIELLKVIPNVSEVMTMMTEILIAESKLTQAILWLNEAPVPYLDFPPSLYKMDVICQSPHRAIYHKECGKNC